MKKPYTKDYPCICTHKQFEHYSIKIANVDEYEACWLCALTGNWCEKFNPDNLKYVEEVYERKLSL